MDFLLFFIFYLIIAISVLGYGLLLNSKLKIYNFELNIGLIGLLGVLFLIIYSYLSHYFSIIHTKEHNSILLTFGLISFIYYFFKNKIKELNFFFIFFIIIFISFILYKTHDDFPYYHFPYTYYLTQNPFMLGIGNFTHGFRTPSSIFYLNSLFYLPIVNYYFFHMGAALFMGFSCISLFIDIKEKIKISNFDNIIIFKLLAFVFIFVFFYRLQEHGTDRSAQILILLLIGEIITLRNSYQNYYFNRLLIKVFILLSLIISLKAFFLIYLILIIPFIFYLIKDKKIHKIKLIFKNSFFYIFLLMLILIILNYIFNTGCLIYPLPNACIFNFDWTIKLTEVNRMSLHYEQWSKAGSGPGYSVENHAEYVKNFNWLPQWIEKYFFNKMLDFLSGLLLLILIFYITLKSKIKIIKKTKKLRFLYLFIFFISLEWFYNHPSLRYGGYCIIAALLFIPFSNYIAKYKQNTFFKTKILGLVILAIIIFLSRNINRLNYEKEFYNFEYLKDPKHRIVEQNFRIDTRIKNLLNKYETCINMKKTCDNIVEGYLIDKKFGIYYFSK